MAAPPKIEDLPEVFEEGNAPPASIQRIRANSTIMKVKKILGESGVKQRAPLSSNCS